MKHTRHRWLLGYEVLLYAVCVLYVTGLVGGHGRWHSQNEYARLQTNALLHGKLALSEEPAALSHDLVWSAGGVHQVWGLGVALWRLPFEVGAKLLGAATFPDRLAFGIALALAAGLVLFCYLPPIANLTTLRQLVAALGAMLILLMFPAFLGLLKSRFDVYEEVIAYEYLFGLALSCQLVGLIRRPARWRFLLLCGLAGLGVFFRPTLFFYGLAAVVAAGCSFWTDREALGCPGAAAANAPGNGWKLFRKLWLGCGIFLLWGGLLFWSNWARFGSGFEFGHRLNVQSLFGSMYATRFDHPFQDEALPSAARELLGLMFFSQNMNGSDYYRSNIFPGQSSTLRWREVYLTTYDPVYLALILCGLTATASAGRRLRHRTSGRIVADDSTCAATIANADDRTNDREVLTLGLWGAVSAFCLCAFYLRNPVIASRYMLDLMPAYAAIILAGWLAWCSYCSRFDPPCGGPETAENRNGSSQAGRIFGRVNWPIATSLIVLSFWIVWEYSASRCAYGGPRSFTWQEVRGPSQSDPRKRTAKPLPEHYDASMKFAEFGIPYNGAGWGGTNGVMPTVVLFINDPQFLELELSSRETGITESDVRKIRAKIGLDFLQQETIQKIANGWRLRFSGPLASRYQHGLQVSFVAFVANTRLADRQTPWRLHSVRWRDRKQE